VKIFEKGRNFFINLPKPIVNRSHLTLEGVVDMNRVCTQLFSCFIFLALITVVSGCRAFNEGYSGPATSVMSDLTNYPPENKTDVSKDINVATEAATNPVTANYGWAKASDSETVTVEATRKSAHTATVKITKKLEDGTKQRFHLKFSKKVINNL